MSVFDKHKKGSAPENQSFEYSAEIAGASVLAHPNDGKREVMATAMANQNYARAFQLYSHGAVIDNPDWIYPLASYAAHERQSDTALSLLNGFSTQYPEHADVVKNYVLAAEIMHQHFGQTKDALALLAQLSARYQSHPDLSLITQLRQQLENVS
ncbi:hypothetical protein [Suttonella ornithocola]|uniref:Tetratricopeptide repeat protein n=1 Tax=Suttonella ornithocola TaxID=279832 RepID=A0A380MSG4_9GAMM|nr:hypothetical protein [Suttonella ornithocola]SUO95520.1 Uncharacterised protein [Suttonella ornithocola]